MTTSAKAVVVLGIGIAGTLGFWAGRTSAPVAEKMRSDSVASRGDASEALDGHAAPAPRELSPAPTSASRIATDASSGAMAGGIDTKAPPESDDAKLTPAPAPAAPGEAKNPLDEIDWKHWVPVLVKYEAVGVNEVPPDDVIKELEKFLTSVTAGLGGRKWETAEDLFRMPDVASRFSVAAAEHFGGAMTPDQRSSLRLKVEKAAAETMKSTKDAIRFERMAGSLEAVARTYATLEGTIGAEKASAVAGFLTGLLLDRSWQTLHLGATAAAGFEATVQQFWAFTATLDAHELADQSRIVRGWWARASVVVGDAVRVHGDAAARAALTAARDDDPTTARARAAATFGGAKALIWAALAREQATAERAFHDLWKTLPEDRRKAFDAVEPSLLLFWPTRD